MCVVLCPMPAACGVGGLGGWYDCWRLRHTHCGVFTWSIVPHLRLSGVALASVHGGTCGGGKAVATLLKGRGAITLGVWPHY